MNKPYHEDGTPNNVICHTRVYVDGVAHFVRFIKLPKVKYFDGRTWLLTSIENENDPDVEKNMFASFLPKREALMPGGLVSFSRLPKDFQKFVIHYYEDTFGAPGDSEGS